MSLSSNAYLELQWYLFSLIFLMGAAYGLNHDYHVRVDVLYERLGRRARAWIDLIGTVLFLVPFAVMMLWVSWGPVVRSWGILETSPDPGGLPRYPIKTVILVSFFLLLLQAISQIVKRPPVRASTRSATSSAAPWRMSRLGGKLVAIRQLTRGPETPSSPFVLCGTVSAQAASILVPAAPRPAFLTNSRRFRWSMVRSQTPSVEKISDGRLGHLAHGVSR